MPYLKIMFKTRKNLKVYFILQKIKDQEKCINAIILGYLVAYPGTVWLLRGNHEEESVNATYGFRTEVLNKYNEETYQAIQGVGC